MIVEAIRKIVGGKDLSNEEAWKVMSEIMSGGATESQIGAFLTALRMKGETINEISAFAAVMKRFCRRINPKVSKGLIDTCGTGGDKIKTFNVSTLTALVIAGAGVPVAKHGNRAVTSRCGSADLLENLGLNLNLEPKEVEEIIEKVGIGFMFAPKFHPAMKHAIGPRREIGIRTVFNILGPLTNPANPSAQLLGVYSQELLEPLAHVLSKLGCQNAMVVHGLDGLDEISIIGKTAAAYLRNGKVTMLEIKPRDFGFQTARAEDIQIFSLEENVEFAFKLLNDLMEPTDPKRRMVLLNAAAGLFVSGRVDSFHEGIELASLSIESGSAYEKLKAMIKTSRGNLTILEELEKEYA